MKSVFYIYIVFIIITIIINIFRVVKKYQKMQEKRKANSPIFNNNPQRNTVSEDEREIFKKLQKVLTNVKEQKEEELEEYEEEIDEYDNEEEYQWEENRNYQEIENSKPLVNEHYKEHKIHLQTEEERLLEMQKNYEERIRQLEAKNNEKVFDRLSIARTDVDEFATYSNTKLKEKAFGAVSIRDAIIYNAILERKKLNYFKLVQKSSDDKIQNTKKPKDKKS